jgi:ribosomal protein L11 methyltransferase
LDGVLVRLRAMPGLDSLVAQTERIEASNWNAAWEADYEPIDVEGLACMRAPFHAAPAHGLDVVIQPQMSFGTGHHATTWQMLRHVLDMPVRGQRILDMGCGTGVLAIAASKLGAASVVAIDIDPWSAENTRNNLDLNGLKAGADVTVLQGDADALEGFPQTFDGMCANINRNILLGDWSAYDRALVPGAWVLMSGFFPSDVDRLREAAALHGWELIDQWEREGWACVQWRKSA